MHPAFNGCNFSQLPPSEFSAAYSKICLDDCKRDVMFHSLHKVWLVELLTSSFPLSTKEKQLNA